MSALRGLSVGALVLTCTIASAQTLSGSYFGDVPGARLGARFDVLGDVDGDGITDLVAGHPDDDTVAADAGRAVVLSGADGAILFTFLGDQPGDQLGYSVGGGGDVDADGVPDVLVGSPTDNSGRGAQHVFSGADGGLIHYQRGLKVGDEFAYDVDGLGDIDGDGHGDYAVGVPGRELGFIADDAGAVYVYSGATGDRVHVFTTPADDENRFGTHVSWVGDVDGDGHDDVLVSGPYGEWDPGAVAVHSGASGALLHAHIGLDQGHGFLERVGHGVAGVGDVDGDDRADYVITHSDPGAPPRMWLISGAAGDLVRQFLVVPHAWEIPLESAGDVDGVPGNELAVGSAGVVHLCSLADGTVLQSITGTGDFGVDFSAIGDIDGDGLDDLAIGSPSDDTAGADAGAIEVWSGNRCGPSRNYCVGAPNSQGEGAVMHYSGSTSIPAADLVIRSEGCPPNQFGLFYYAPNEIQIPFGDGFRCAGGAFWRLGLVSTGGDGIAEKAVDYGALPSGGQIEPGSAWCFQYLYRDPNGPLGSGFNASDGLKLYFCP